MSDFVDLHWRTYSTASCSDCSHTSGNGDSHSQEAGAKFNNFC